MDVSTELTEGAALVAAAAARCGQIDPDTNEDASGDRVELDAAATVLAGTAPAAERTRIALDDRLLALMTRHADRSLASAYPRVLQVWVDRERARFGAWYEMFPRSWGPDATRSATLGEAAAQLANIAALGFDVVYLPPIHPIGRSFRKGRGNSLTPGPNDPGSPWAIGSIEGGHKAVEPGLGTLDDFDAFVASAHRHGLEVALDLAYQCSPDHPYVKSNPEWFRHRPDGTIKYAENPPKKYQDIYPFNFETTAWPALWDELLDVVRFWIGHGVRIFRVDNPHTKPYGFWEWLIASIRREHPDVIFLSEAFTRPKVMGYLAKLGFTQSYTYFTWRNTKVELEEYFTELTGTDLREYLRPNLFANTPDILHAYLQEGGPPAFKIRLVLAATLGAAYGIYSGFELCENRAVPGSEEYLDSEKYQLRHWDWERPGHIKDLVAAVNRIRHENAALQFDWGLAFHPTDNPEIIAYTKTSPDAANVVLVVVNLDPRNVQHGWVAVPGSAFGAGTNAPCTVRDLLTGNEFPWRGGHDYVRLDPAGVPAHIFRVVP
jgi:starch synthase (maltosyl-transferring)